MTREQELYNYGIDEKKADFSPTQPRKAEQHTNTPQEEETDYTSYLASCINNNDFKYLLSRGISEETQINFNIGYVKDWKNPKNPTAPASPRCIIPTSNYSYNARSIEGEDVQKVGKVHIFNESALKKANNHIIFIVSNEIDAMSIEEVGFNACAFGGAPFIRLMLKEIDNNYSGQVFCIIANQEEAETKALKALEDGLKERHILYVMEKSGTEDTNSDLMIDRQLLIDKLNMIKENAEDLYKERSENEYSALDILNYFVSIENNPQYYEASTGFKELDKHLYGGLHEGLYIIGAISSLGKTTFMLQLADQVAKAGKDVLFFSLEMSKHEIMAKSLSRYTFKQNGRQRTSKGDFIAKDTAQILNGKRYAYYTESEKEAIKSAINAYKSEVAPHFYIYEGGYKGERLTANHIRQIVKDHIAKTGHNPIVIVDYLQILASPSNLTDKQATDESVYILKDISRTYTIPVIAISSFNRDNYNNPVSMASFKESGAIEYSSDILLGLQYAGMDYQTGEGGEKDKARAERIRTLVANNFEKKRNKEPIDIELKCLKARTGYQFTVAFKMVNAFNSFEEVGEDGSYTHEGSTPFEDVKTSAFAQAKANRKKV